VRRGNIGNRAPWRVRPSFEACCSAYITYALGDQDELSLPIPDQISPNQQPRANQAPCSHTAHCIPTHDAREPSWQSWPVRKCQKLVPFVAKRPRRRISTCRGRVFCEVQCESGRRGGTIVPSVGDDDVELPCNVGYQSECHDNLSAGKPDRGTSCCRMRWLTSSLYDRRY
jgi:hypothetical protein